MMSRIVMMQNTEGWATRVVLAGPLFTTCIRENDTTKLKTGDYLTEPRGARYVSQKDREGFRCTGDGLSTRSV